MKQVLILFGKGRWRQKQPFSSDLYRASYETFYTMAHEQGIQLCRASYEWYSNRLKRFKYAWTFDVDSKQWKRLYNVQPDLVYDKTPAKRDSYAAKDVIGKAYKFVNRLDFTRLMDDKFVTSLLLQKWSKKTWIVSDKKRLKRVLPEIGSSKFVMKPLRESGGSGVKVMEKSDVSDLERVPRRSLVQGFIESEGGVPGLSDGRHDLRLIFVNEQLIYAYIREPADGRFLANLSQGGSLTIVPNEDIPDSVQPIVDKMQNLFDGFPTKIFSIDLMFDEDEQPWVVELNSMPGLFYTPEEKASMLRLYKALIEVFQDEIGRV